MTVLLLALAHAAPLEVARLPDAHVQRPRWSPGGTRLAYEANHHDTQSIQTFVGQPGATFEAVALGSRAGGALLEGFATHDVGGRVIHELAWAPNAPGIYAFTASNAQRDYDLYISEGVPLAPAPGADGGATWSPDGRYLAFTSARTGQGDLYLLDIQSIEAPPRRLTDDATHSELFPTWSADSGALVFVGHGDDGDHLWLLDGLDAAPVALTGFRGLQIRPRFAPRGRMVAFYANQEDPERFDLYVVEARAGATAVKLVDDVVVDSQGPSWSPDGAHLVYVADDDAAYDPVRMVPASGGAPRTLDLGTVGHGDLDVVLRDGTPWLAWVAQGAAEGGLRDFRALYVAPLP